VTQRILTDRYHNCRHLFLSLALKQCAQTSFKTYDRSRWMITFLHSPKYSKKCVLYHISILFPWEYLENDFRINLNQIQSAWRWRRKFLWNIRTNLHNTLYEPKRWFGLNDKQMGLNRDYYFQSASNKYFSTDYFMHNLHYWNASLLNLGYAH
jgi:hypothetical protein